MVTSIIVKPELNFLWLLLDVNLLYVSMLVRNLLLIALLTNSSREISPSPSPSIELRMSCRLILFDKSQYSWTPEQGACHDACTWYHFHSSTRYKLTTNILLVPTVDYDTIKSKKSN